MQTGATTPKNTRQHATTGCALLHYNDQLLNNMEKKSFFLRGFAEAFDSIRHDLLLLKLRRLGVSDSAHSWFESYLSSCIQIVKIGSVLPDPLPLTVGVAQGSILGPVLFTLYVNELLSVPKNCQTMGYVYDTKILLSVSTCNVTEASDAFNSVLKEVSRWCCANSASQI